MAIGVPHKQRIMRHSILFSILPPAELLRKILVSQKTGSALPADAMVDETGADSKIPKPFMAQQLQQMSQIRVQVKGNSDIRSAQGIWSWAGLRALAGALTGAGTNACNRPFCNGMLSIILTQKS